MSSIDKIRMLKKILKETLNIRSWQEEIYTMLHNIDASWVVSGIFDVARIPTPLTSKGLSEVFTAGASITAGQVVAITGDNEVSPADDTLRSQTVGVALNNAAVGEPVEVLIYGKATVIADGVINAGDPVAAAPTPGRVVSLLSHKHSNPNTSSVNLAHTHGVGTLSISSAGSHRHDCPTTGSAGEHSHGVGTLAIDSAGAHTHSFTPSGSISTAGSHRHEFGTRTDGKHSHGASSSLVASHSHDFTPSGIVEPASAGIPQGSISSETPHNTAEADWAIAPSMCPLGHPNCAVGSAHHTLAIGNGSHNHTFTGSLLPSHSHDFIGSTGETSYAGGHSHTINVDDSDVMQSAGSHSHTFTGSTGTTSSSGAHTHGISGSTASAGAHTHPVGYTTYAGSHSHSMTGSTGSALGSHSHTVGDTSEVGTAQIVGKALTSASGAGESIDILVCLAG